MLGEDKYRELINYTLQKIRKKFGNIKIDGAIEIENKNHEALFIIALLKVYRYEDNEIKKVLGWENEEGYKLSDCKNIQRLRNCTGQQRPVYQNGESRV